MNNSRTRWIGGTGAVVLVGALLVTSVVAADDDKGKHPNGSGDGHHTLRWDTNHASATRFTTAFPGAVLDKNTGLVWEQAPEVTPLFWFIATFYCVNKTVGATVGWRLPSVVELKSVQDPSLAAPLVPASIFTGVQSALYWSATTSADFPTFAWGVNFGNGVVDTNLKAVAFPAWCVRGPMQESVY